MKKPPEAKIEKYYQPAVVAERLGISRKTVERRFDEREGVKRDGTMTTTRDKRRYALWFISESAIQRYLAALHEGKG